MLSILHSFIALFAFCCTRVKHPLQTAICSDRFRLLFVFIKFPESLFMGIMVELEFYYKAQWVVWLIFTRNEVDSIYRVAPIKVGALNFHLSAQSKCFSLSFSLRCRVCELFSLSHLLTRICFNWSSCIMVVVTRLQVPFVITDPNSIVEFQINGYAFPINR